MSAIFLDAELTEAHILKRKLKNNKGTEWKKTKIDIIQVKMLSILQ